MGRPAASRAVRARGRLSPDKRTCRAAVPGELNGWDQGASMPNGRAVAAIALGLIRSPVRCLREGQPCRCRRAKRAFAMADVQLGDRLTDDLNALSERFRPCTWRDDRQPRAAEATDDGTDCASLRQPSTARRRPASWPKSALNRSKCLMSQSTRLSGPLARAAWAISSVNASSELRQLNTPIICSQIVCSRSDRCRGSFTARRQCSRSARSCGNGFRLS